MNKPLVIKDNIAELLAKIIEFTQTRQKIITQNINNLDTAGFVPKDLAINEFCDSLNCAITEHTQNQRLVFCDTENVNFGSNGSFEVRAIADTKAKELLEEDRDKYIELQLDKLLENSLNQRAAAELFRQKEGMVSIFE